MRSLSQEEKGKLKMYPLSPGRQPTPPTVTSELVSPDVIFTTMRGYLDASLTVQAANHFEQLLAQASRPTWLSDILELASFEPYAVVIGGTWWAKFKAHQGQKVLLVSNVATFHMIAATLGFGAGVPVKTFASVREARQYLGVKVAL